jgi:hypothetical protein
MAHRPGCGNRCNPEWFQSTRGDSAGDDERKAEERRIRRLIDERLVAIQQRRRTTGRDQLTIGR